VKLKQVLDSVDSGSLHNLLRSRFHQDGSGRKPYDPACMLKAQLLKHLLRISSDRRLALRLKHDRRAARVCGFGKRTPCHSLFTHFKQRLGIETYLQVFNQLLEKLLELER